jgi:Ca-activated chloride channel family protein
MVKRFVSDGSFVAALLILTCPLACSQENPESAGAIRVRVNMVSVGVIVTDGEGRFIEDLQREDFHVLDNGVEQPIRYFSLDQPSHVLLLIEPGPAVFLLEGGHLRAAYSLLAGLSAGDQVAVVKYAEGPQAICDFSADKQVAAAALEHLNFNLGFGALNLSESMARVLDWLDKTPGKKTVVLLSTGVDTSAPVSTAGLLQRLRVEDVRVLSVSSAGEMRTPATSKKKQVSSPAAILSAEQFAAADEELRQLTDATGGRAYFPVDAKGFAAAYAEIAQIVRHEYSLGFSPSVLDGKEHRIEVRVTMDEARERTLRVDHRQAYLAKPGQ